MSADALVLGAGIVGVSVALHLQKRGRATVLLDRRGSAEETSFGNAGLVQREGVYPYGFPHDFGALLRYGMNRTIDAHYHPSAIPRLAPFLWKYWHHSRPARHRAIAHQYAKLIEHCIAEHEALAVEAGALELFRRTGWMKVFRTARASATGAVARRSAGEANSASTLPPWIGSRSRRRSRTWRRCWRARCTGPTRSRSSIRRRWCSAT